MWSANPSSKHRAWIFCVGLGLASAAHAWGPVGAKVGLKNETYFSESAANGTFVSWSLAAGFDPRSSWSYVLNAQGKTPTNGTREGLAEVGEAAVVWGRGARWLGSRQPDRAMLRLTLGRALKPWNAVDSEWTLGIVEARYRGDEIDPLPVGLTGLFAEVRRDRFEVLAFASPLHVPERGVPFAVVDGQLNSRSPWFVEAPRQVLFLDQGTPIRYDARVPPLGELALQPSFGGKLTRDFGDDVKVGAFWLNKPVQQLAVGYDAVLGLNDLVASVDLFPRSMRHHVAGGDFVWRRRSGALWTAYLYDRPYDVGTVRGSTVQRFATAHVAGVGISQTLFFPFGDLRPTLGLSYLHVTKARDRDFGPLAQVDGSSIFPDRYRMRRALRASAALPLGRAWQVAGAFVRDVMYSASLLQASVAYRGLRSWEFIAAADVLGSPVNDGFLAPFRANDRASLEIRYAF